MSNFCKGCSEEMFGQDFGDFAGLSTEEQTKMGIFASVLCEGCGETILVDHTGTRIDERKSVDEVMKAQLEKKMEWDLIRVLDPVVIEKDVLSSDYECKVGTRREYDYMTTLEQVLNRGIMIRRRIGETCFEIQLAPEEIEIIKNSPRVEFVHAHGDS